MSANNCSLLDQTTDTYTYGIPCNDVVGSANLLSGEVEFMNYGYILSAGSPYAFLILFCIVTTVHFLTGAWWRQWWTIYTFGIGGLLEILGWAGRLWSYLSQDWDRNNGGDWYTDNNAFILQVVCLVIAPVFFSAANYILLGKVAWESGDRYTSFRADSFATLFIVADVLCLLVQVVGGIIAGIATTSSGANTGAYIMTAGVCLQLGVTAVYIWFLGELTFRMKKQSPALKQYNPLPRCCGRRSKTRNQSVDSNASGTAINKESSVSEAAAFRAQSEVSESRLWAMIYMMLWATLLIVVRSCYRAAELSHGWTGPIASNLNLFLGMDASLMFVLLVSWAIIHPGLAFGKRLF